MSNIFILYIQDSNGHTTEKSVEANSSHRAVHDHLDGKWIKVSAPRGMYESGAYSFDKGFITVKKPNGVHDWFKRI